MTPDSANRAATRVLLVDDHPLIRDGLRRLIRRQDDMEVCGEASSPHEALRVAADAEPDVAVVDLALGEESGLELIKDLHHRHPDLLILVLSMHEESVYAERVLRAGARGYVMKGAELQTVMDALRHVLSGEVYLSDRMTLQLMRRVAGAGQGGEESPVHGLSDRELEVFEMIGQGMGPTAIADRLHLSVKTIETYRDNIKVKLNLPDALALRRSAIQWAHQEGRQ
ncbi:MAG: response regulator transcription factor [Planctomycetota bacterium]